MGVFGRRTEGFRRIISLRMGFVVHLHRCLFDYLHWMQNLHCNKNCVLCGVTQAWCFCVRRGFIDDRKAIIPVVLFRVGGEKQSIRSGTNCGFFCRPDGSNITPVSPYPCLMTSSSSSLLSKNCLSSSYCSSLTLLAPR